MKWVDLGRYYLKQRIKYEVTDGWSADLAMFGAMSDTVNYLIENSENKDRKIASDIVYTFCVGSFDKIIGKNKNNRNR